MKLSHKDMIESIEDYTKRYTIIKGFCDVKYHKLIWKCKITNNDYWIILGNTPNEVIDNIFNEEELTPTDEINQEGHYQYTACIYYSPSTWEEPSEQYIDYIKLELIETFTQRKRNEILNNILNSKNNHNNTLF